VTLLARIAIDDTMLLVKWLSEGPTGEERGEVFRVVFLY
jgi:hypothetical protein